MTTEFFCTYHPPRNAVDKCENCSSYICLECKKIFRGGRSRKNSSLFDSRLQRSDPYSTKTVLCPLCYYDAEENQQSKSNRTNILFPLIFVSIFLGFFLFILAILFIFIGDSNSFTIVFWVFVPIFVMVPIIFVGIFIFTIRVSRPKKSMHIQKEREAFQQSLDLPQSTRISSFQNTASFCTTCGAIIEFNERYCPKCGSSIHNF